MIRLIPLFLLTLVAASAMVQETTPQVPAVPGAKINQQQLTEGWVNLFDGESLYGWHAPDGSKWTVTKGMLAPQGEKAATLVTTSAFKNYMLDIEYQTRNEKVEILCNFQPNEKMHEPTNRYRLPPTGAGTGWLRLHVHEGALLGGEESVTGPFGLGRTLNATKSGSPVRKGSSTGQIAVHGTGVVIHSIRLHPNYFEEKPLFNGKNLDGWKVAEGKAGKFSVTKEGWLAIKDGPGDLATEKQFSDFVLQLECKSNGKHLNSGIFFRALPGQYQMGYEAQIHNGWMEKAKTIEVDAFDAKGEPKGKEKLETLAADFGTGAIYRRVPARKQLAEDNEWFHMTVVANGRRIATWVNGIQAVDWVDPRAEKENPRQGCRLGAGTISIQAHDPTTDLLFRNIRVLDQATKKE